MDALAQQVDLVDLTKFKVISTSSLRASLVSLIIENTASETIEVLPQNFQRHLARVPVPKG